MNCSVEITSSKYPVGYGHFEKLKTFRTEFLNLDNFKIHGFQFNPNLNPS